MIYILTAITIFTTGLWVYLLYLVNQNLKNQKSPAAIRGILKHYNLGNLGADLNKIIKQWLIVFAALFIIIYSLVFYFTWGTDYNFLIAVYPFVWHYMFFRYFLWEKEDLLEHSPKK